MYNNKVEITSLCTSRLPSPTREENDILMKKVKAGDAHAREEFVTGNLRLVLSSLRQFTGKKENADDLFQVGVIGLLKAVDNFDLSVGVTFSTYAVPTDIPR